MNRETVSTSIFNQDKRNEKITMENKKTALIIGAGPAGLTAAYELLKRTDYKPIIFEMSSDIGGISKTINYSP